MSGMAEVLAAHRTIDVALYPDHYCCSCGHKGLEQPSTHQAAMLTAAGFGPVKEAGAVALEEAAREMREERRMWCLDDAGRYWIKRTLDDLEERAAAVRGYGA